MAVDSHDDSSHDWKHRTDEKEKEEEEKKRSEFEYHGMNDLLLPSRLKVDHSREYGCTYGEEIDRQANGLHRYLRKSQASKSGPEIRFINSAIYAESCDTEEENDGVEVRIKVAGPRPIVESESFSRLSIDPIPVEYAADRPKNPDTYRRSTSSTINSGYTEVASTVCSGSGPVSGKSSARVERWCRIDQTANGNPSDDRWSGGRPLGQPEVHRYVLNGHRVVQMSSTSASASSTSISDFGKVNGLALARKLAHEEWLRDKRSYVQQKRQEQKRENKEKLQEVERFEREREERVRKEKDSFLKWTERKRKEEAEKKAALEKELELQRRLKEIEDNASIAKTICLRQWVRKKVDEQKAQQKEESAKRKQEEEERGRRLEESVRAYEKWREISKNRPKPATQGLLPHQKAKPSYVNPTPWQGASGDEGDQARNDHQSYNKKETKANSVKSNRRNIPLHR